MAGPEIANKKRRRQENEIAFKKHSSLWFDDGNVVLRAQRTLFCVHRSMLSRHSDIFRDIFTVPQPPEGSEKFDNKPVVELHDSPIELADFLDVLYNGMKFNYHGHKPTYVVVQSLMRLSSKYCVEHLRKEALCCLEDMLPGDITRCDEQMDTKKQALLYSVSDMISVANLTRELGLAELHYRALYQCSQLSTLNLISGVQHGTRGTLEKLSERDIFKCLNALPRLTIAVVQMLDKLFSTSYTGCLTPFHCPGVLMQIYLKIHTSAEIISSGALRPLDGFLHRACRDVSLDFGKTGPCSNCVRSIKLKALELRGEILKNLKDYFG